MNAVTGSLRGRWARVGSSRRLSGLTGRFVGDPAAGSLLPVQSLHSVGETLFAVSLAGSLFFNVSVDAARPRILLYLAVTMAPFVILGPLIGPFMDKVGGGQRTMLMVALGGRALAALLLAGQVRSLLFYPVAFVIIVLAKVFAVSRNAVVPVLVEAREHLVMVNSRLARIASISGALAAPLALWLLTTGGAAMVLRGAAVVYGLGAVAAWRMPEVHPAPQPAASRVVESTEMAGPGISAATVVMAGMRAAVGFTLFHIGFALKQAGDPTWVFGVLAAASAGGTFLGTFVAPRLRRRWSEPRILTVVLVLPLAMGVVSALRFHAITVGVLAFALGLSASVARRAFDGVVQTEAPHARRGQAFAGLETRLELAWVLGALAAVSTRAPGWIGTAALAAGFALLLLERVVRRRDAARIGAVSHTATLPLRLLETAEALAARGDSQQAVVVAMAAVDAANDTGMPTGPRAEELHRLAHLVANEEEPDATEAALVLAHELVASALEAGAEAPAAASVPDRG